MWVVVTASSFVDREWFVGAGLGMGLGVHVWYGVSQAGGG